MLPNVSAPAEYGLPKTDYDSNGVVDPETELAASEYEAIGVDVAALTHVSPKAIVVCTVDDGPGTIVVSAYRSVWGDEVAVYPTAVRNGEGDFTLTWAVGGYPDLNPTVARRVTRAPNFIAAHPMIVDGASADDRTARVKSVAANSVNVLTFDETGTASDLSFTLWVY